MQFKKIRETVLRDWVPFALSALALILGVGPGWPFLWTFRLAEYDPTIAVLTATLVALIWTADYTFHAVQDSRDRESREAERRESARKSILGGLVAELDAQYTWLGQVSEQLYHVRISLDRPMMAEALRNAQLFEGDVIPVISNFNTHFQVIDGALTRLTDYASTMASSDYLLLTPVAIERLAPGAVQSLRENIAILRENIWAGARLLSPETYPRTGWAKLDADSSAGDRALDVG
jgi:hypothetical protein